MIKDVYTEKSKTNLSDALINIPRVRVSFLICFILIVLTVLLYLPVTKYGFVNYDDVDYVIENIHVKKGLTFEGFKWAFFAFYAANWHPMTWISHMLDVQLYGLDPGKHHSVNIIFHVLNTILLYIFFNKATGKMWASLIIASLFAIHPVHVESVAWIAERKDVLSTFFMFLTLLLYFRYVKYQKKWAYFLSLIFFTFGLMSKPMLVSLPFLLLLLDYWPFCRIFAPRNECIATKKDKHSVSYPIIEKIPFFILSAISSLITILAQKSGDAVVSIKVLPIEMRISNAIISYIDYITKIFYPIDLAVPYPYPEKISLTYVLIAFAIIIILTLLPLHLLKSKRYFLFGWFWFIGALVPVIGIVQVGSQSMADRYLYIPAIGIYVIIAMICHDLSEKNKKIKKWLVLLLSIFFIFFAYKARVQMSFWKDGASLFNHAVNVTRNNMLAYYNLGMDMSDLGRSDEAIKYYLKAIEINPTESIFHTNLAVEYKIKGDFANAVKHFEIALKSNPNQVEALCNMAIVIFEQYGKTKEAINYLNKAIRLKPEYFLPYNILGNIMLIQGHLVEAIGLYSRCILLNPEYPDAYNSMGAALVKLGRLNEAELFFSEAIAINPINSLYRSNIEAVQNHLKVIHPEINSSVK